ncbi:MAG: RNA-binding cell elongation regulator Jag/EloR [Bacillota bacterium]|nr:RNA-binding cell elongation regulator Jag/EloR [Bacillota bacterium]
MIKEAIGLGETEVEALAAACKELGLETHEVEFEILESPGKKKFGLFGGTPAKVRAYVSVSPADIAVEYLKGVLSAMGGGDIQVEVTQNEDGAVINLTGEHVGMIIGRRGETMDALQYLTGLVANHVNNSYFRITIDTENYRDKREKTLEILGRKMAFKAVKTGRNFSLEPMNPYERRLIHTSVQQVNGALSWSEGENMNRHVVIGVDPKLKRPNNNNRGPRRDFNKRPPFNRDNRDRRPPQNVQTTPSPDRKPRVDGGDFSLYGKIEKTNKE